jgi:hypothetical protein
MIKNRRDYKWAEIIHPDDKDIQEEIIRMSAKKMADDLDAEILSKMIYSNPSTYASGTNTRTSDWNVIETNWPIKMSDPFSKAAAYDELIPKFLALCAIVKEKHGTTLNNIDSDPDFKTKEEKAKSYIKYIREDDNKKDVAAISFRAGTDQ